MYSISGLWGSEVLSRKLDLCIVSGFWKVIIGLLVMKCWGDRKVKEYECSTGRVEIEGRDKYGYMGINEVF